MIGTVKGKVAEAEEMSTFPAQDFSAVEMAQIRHILYRLFASSCLYPDAARLETIRGVATSLREESATWSLFPFGEALQQMLDLAAALPAGDNLPLQEEYIRLFAVKPAAVPYESFYVDQEGLARSLVVSTIQADYLAAGLEVAPGRVEPPDHIAVELEFIAYLVNLELKGLEEGAERETAVARQRQVGFLRTHLKRWYPAFAKRVQEAAPDPFYGTLVQAVFMFLHHELATCARHES